MNLAVAAALFTLSLAHAEPAADEGAPESTGHVEGDNGKIGVAILAGGAALATGTAAGVTLLEAITRPDDGRTKPDHPELVQVSGFATVTLASLSAGLIIVGAALLLDDTLEQKPTPPPAP